MRIGGSLSGLEGGCDQNIFHEKQKYKYVIKVWEF